MFNSSCSIFIDIQIVKFMTGNIDFLSSRSEFRTRGSSSANDSEVMMRLLLHEGLEIVI